MKLFSATLSTETNTFTPLPTGRHAFTRERPLLRGTASRTPAGLANLALIEWCRLAERDGHTVVESICASAEPGGVTVRAIYEELRAMLVEDLRAALPVDGVLLKLHGAMVAEGYDDCEGDVIAHVREIVGPGVPIGVELDLHCHLTETIRTNADVVITYKEYPHTDIVERAREVYALVVAAAEGKIRPVVAFHDLRMVSMWRTPVEPARSIVARMTEMEGKDGILSVSFGHGFPWGDVPDQGAKTVVVADGDPAKAERAAAELARLIWDTREASITPHDSIDAGIDAALAAPSGPVVLADVADNAGAGAPSDSTFVLRRLVERGVKGAAIGCIWDPVAVLICQEAGIGATLKLRIGGKAGTVSGDPVDLTVTVRGLADEHSQTGLSGGRMRFGPSAWVEADGIHIILITVRCQVLAPDAFTGIGCTLDDKRVVVVKSIQHFYGNFVPIAKEIRYVAAPGAVGPDFAAIPYERFTRLYWPRVADPFAAG